MGAGFGGVWGGGTHVLQHGTTGLGNFSTDQLGVF